MFIVPLQWLFVMVVAVTVHELGHLTALRLFGVRPTGLHVDLTGIRLSIPPLPPWQELVCAASGPAASGLLVLLSGLFPRLALCALVHGLFNLVPVYPLDGGRVLRCFLILLFKENTACRLSDIIGTGILLLIALFCLYLVRYLGIAPLLAAVLLGIRSLERKRPCKSVHLRVQ